MLNTFRCALFCYLSIDLELNTVWSRFYELEGDRNLFIKSEVSYLLLNYILTKISNYYIVFILQMIIN